MLDIEYKGANSVVISTKNQRLVVDPKLSIVGGTDVVVKDSVVLATEARFLPDSKEMSAVRMVVEGPGEYEIGDISVRGVAGQRHIDEVIGGTTIYTIVISGIRIVLLGNIAPNLTDGQLEEIGVVDILIVPVGGNGYTLDNVSAAKVVRQIEPKVVVPVHYGDDGLNYEVSQNSVGEFIKMFDTDGEDTKKYKIKSELSLPEVMTVVKITRS